MQSRIAFSQRKREKLSQQTAVFVNNLQQKFTYLLLRASVSSNESNIILLIVRSYPLLRSGSKKIRKAEIRLGRGGRYGRSRESVNEPRKKFKTEDAKALHLSLKP